MIEEHTLDDDAGVTITLTDHPDGADYAAVLETLRQFSRETVRTLDNRDFGAFVSDRADGGVLGGIVGSSRWGGFQIDILALPASLRGKGLGTRLLRLAEDEARRRECHHIWLDTYAFQARAFYERHGFSVFGQLDGPGPFYPRFFMRKLL